LLPSESLTEISYIFWSVYRYRLNVFLWALSLVTPLKTVQVLVYKKLTAPWAQLVTWMILPSKISAHEFFDTYSISIVVYYHQHEFDPLSVRERAK